VQPGGHPDGAHYKIVMTKVTVKFTQYLITAPPKTSKKSCTTFLSACVYLRAPASPSRSSSYLSAPLPAAPLRPRRPTRHSSAKGAEVAFARPHGRAACPRSSDRPIILRSPPFALSLDELPLRAARRSSASSPPTPSPRSRERQRRRARLPLLTCCSPRVNVRWFAKQLSNSFMTTRAVRRAPPAVCATAISDNGRRAVRETNVTACCCTSFTLSPSAAPCTRHLQRRWCTRRVDVQRSLPTC
jgi:hypothetical protein